MGGNHSTLKLIVGNMSPQEKAASLFIAYIKEQIDPEKIVNRALKKFNKEIKKPINKDVIDNSRGQDIIKNQSLKIPNYIQIYVNDKFHLGEDFNLPIPEQSQLLRRELPLSRQASFRYDHYFGKGRKRKSKRMSKRRSRKRR